jgi:hypothetical protein
LGKKRRKAVYDVVTALKLRAFPAEYEELTKDLYAKACRGSDHLWAEITDYGKLRDDGELRENFYRSANQAMMEAQDDIIAIIQGEERPDFPKEVLIRGIADSIAWQLIGHQLAYARRFFKSSAQPDLYNCNLESVVAAAKETVKLKENAVALISDLTSFIQVGDLLVCEPERGLTIAEVKAGSENDKIFDFMKFYMESNCDRAVHLFAQQEGEKSFKQFQRMLRQADRMSHVSSVLKTGKGIDPDTSEEINIPDPFFEFETWDARLVLALDKASEKGWAVDVIDECLFIGVYASKEMRIGGHIVFNSWFDSMGGTPECPRARLIDSMQTPLALPIFNRNIPDKYKFDVLFGRKQVCMGICIESLIEECKKIGLSVRVATNKELGRLDNTGNRPYRHKGNGIFIGNGTTEFAIMDGIFLRVMFHGQSPLSVIKTLLKGAEEAGLE